MQKKLLQVFTSILFITSATPAVAAQGSAKSKMKVVTGITVDQVSDLIFSDASAGSLAETIPADASETPGNASFKIRGEAHRAVIISLPPDNLIKMKTGLGTADSEIAVNGFISNNPTTIDTNGELDLYVGATRAALSANQVAGNYEAEFVVDVVYQ